MQGILNKSFNILHKKYKHRQWEEKIADLISADISECPRLDTCEEWSKNNTSQCYNEAKNSLFCILKEKYNWHHQESDCLEKGSNTRKCLIVPHTSNNQHGCTEKDTPPQRCDLDFASISLIGIYSWHPIEDLWKRILPLAFRNNCSYTNKSKNQKRYTLCNSRISMLTSTIQITHHHHSNICRTVREKNNWDSKKIAFIGKSDNSESYEKNNINPYICSRKTQDITHDKSNIHTRNVK